MSFKQLKKRPFTCIYRCIRLVFIRYRAKRFCLQTLFAPARPSSIYNLCIFSITFWHIYSFHQLIFATYCHQTNSRRCLRAVGHRLSQARNSRSRSQCLRGVIIYPHVVYISRVFPSTGFQASPSFPTFPYCFFKKPYYPYFLVKIVGEII